MSNHGERVTAKLISTGELVEGFYVENSQSVIHKTEYGSLVSAVDPDSVARVCDLKERAAKEGIKITELGWEGDFCAASMCNFRRNTLIEHNEVSVIVSTVGNMISDGKVTEIGCDRHYETMVFHSQLEGEYIEIGVTKEIDSGVDGCLSITPENNTNIDNQANEMHEANVKKVCEMILNGGLK